MFRELQEGKGLIVYLFAAIKIQDRGKRRWMEGGEGSNFKYNISKTGFYQVRQGQDQQREGNWGSLPEAELSSQYNPVNIRNGIQQNMIVVIHEEDIDHPIIRWMCHLVKVDLLVEGRQEGGGGELGGLAGLQSSWICQVPEVKWNLLVGCDKQSDGGDEK